MSTKIIMLLDESGSMGTNKANVIRSVNTFINEQRDLSTENVCTMDLIKFNHVVTPIYNNVDIKSVNNITKNDYNPSGGTSLYDAMGSIMVSNKDRNNVVLVIITDGFDTSSIVYSKNGVKNMVARYSAPPYSWNIIYLVSDIEVSRAGDEIGITDNGLNVTNMNIDFDNMNLFTTSLSRAVSNFRTGSSSVVNMSTSN